MTKLLPMSDAIAKFVPGGSSVTMGLQMEMIPFAAGHEIIRQKKRGLTLVGPISDVLFDQMFAGGCVERVIAAWSAMCWAKDGGVSLGARLTRTPHLRISGIEMNLQQRHRDTETQRTTPLVVFLCVSAPLRYGLNFSR